MFIDINAVIKAELQTMGKTIDAVKVLIKGSKGASRSDGKQSSERKEGQLYERRTSEGVVYHLRECVHGRRISRKLGKADNEEVIRIKQNMYNKEMCRRLEHNIKLLGSVEDQFLPYDPDSVDKGLKDIYRDQTGLVNKAPGVMDLKEWDGINKKNGYKKPDDPNIAPDGLETRSKSEIIVYSIMKGYGLILKYDMEIKLKDDNGEIVTVCPDFVILCFDGSLIIVEHLGMLDKEDYLLNTFRRIHLYLINGFKLNKNLFLTADHAKGKIDAQAVDELVRKMILPRAKGNG